ncbi:MAG TPA: GNAT family N-acetyltransferase [Blastocatellia bacterium]|nr:GNAT family N-acetyltransferase [Blastocatellia bacterium]
MKSALAIAMPDTEPPAPRDAASRHASWPTLTADQFLVASITDFAALDEITVKWQDLAAHAVEANPFYEPARLRDALARHRANTDLRLVLIFAPNRARPAEPLLCGVFPLERRRHQAIACRTLRLWQYEGCELATPLVRATHAEPTLEAFFAWLASADHGCALLEFNRVSGEGAFHTLLVDYLDHHAVLHHASPGYRAAQGHLLRDVTVGTGSRGDLIVSLLPLLTSLKRQRKPVAQARPGKMFAVAVEDPAQLARYAADWDQLAESVGEPNPFYERWMFEPALAAFGKDRRLIFVFIFASEPDDPSSRPLLCGFFPLDLGNRYDGLGRRLPLKTLSLWKHKYGYLCTPLVREGRAAETVAAFFAWLDAHAHGAAVMDFQYIAAGPFHRALAEYLHQSECPHYQAQSFTRALLTERNDAADYLREALSREHRKDLRRKERRLAENGALEYAALSATDDPRPWIAEYIEVEDLSWKGRQGCALSSTPGEREFFEAIAMAAFARGRLMMLALRAAGRAVACKCNFIAGRGSYAFKIAFDERDAAASPGILLEVENIRRLHQSAELDWMDSCANSHNAMINRMWLDRLPVQSIAVSASRRGRLAVALMPLLKWANRQIFRRDLARGKSARAIQIIAR